MIVSACVAMLASGARLCSRLGACRPRSRRGCEGDRGQATAEYALVIVGAAAVALLLLAWATRTGAISDLLDKVVGTVADMVT